MGVPSAPNYSPYRRRPTDEIRYPTANVITATAIPVLMTPAGVILALPCSVMCFPTRRSKTDFISSG